LYLKEIPITLNYKTIKHARIVGQFFGIVLFTAIITFTVLNNITPFGITVQYDMGANTKSMSQLGPKNRVTAGTYNGVQVSKITDNLVYFTTDMPFDFDTATVKVYFQNPSPDQTFSVGFQDQLDWHYNLKPYDAPFLNGLNWTSNGYDPVLYQKQQNYPSADAFLRNSPHNAIIGTFDYDNDIGDPTVNLPNYKPQKQETVINTPLRGKQIIYAYLDHEPFHMIIQKQELNWYPNPDTMTVSVFKNNQLVYKTTSDDDGITDGSRKVLPPTDVRIDNPGTPESGVYKIVIDANGDTLIKSISTNLHKIVFANALYPVANSSVYGSVVASTSATTVYTNALSLSAVTYHNNGEQTLTVGSESAILNMLQIPLQIIPPDRLTKIVAPQNDVILNGFQGYFSFSPDQFFTPSNYYVMPVNTQEDLNMIDYLVTDYHPSHQENGWQVNEQTFDMSTANVVNNKLSWVIQSPKLKQNGGSLIIKDIQVTFHKKGWLRL